MTLQGRGGFAQTVRVPSSGGQGGWPIHLGCKNAICCVIRWRGL